MSIRIQSDRCIGCRQCIEECPGNLIKWNCTEHHAYMLHPRDCWGCASCIKVCPANAISYFLGADIGGRGMQMTVSCKSDQSIWNFTDTTGEVTSIVIDRRRSNQY